MPWSSSSSSGEARTRVEPSGPAVASGERGRADRGADRRVGERERRAEPGGGEDDRGRPAPRSGPCDRHPPASLWNLALAAREEPPHRALGQWQEDRQGRRAVRRSRSPSPRCRRCRRPGRQVGEGGDEKAGEDDRLALASSARCRREEDRPEGGAEVVGGGRDRAVAGREAEIPGGPDPERLERRDLAEEVAEARGRWDRRFRTGGSRSSGRSRGRRGRRRPARAIATARSGEARSAPAADPVEVPASPSARPPPAQRRGSPADAPPAEGARAVRPSSTIAHTAAVPAATRPGKL